MGTSETGFIERLVAEEIQRLIAAAIKDGGTISTSECAAQISRVYAGSGLSMEELADKIIMAAASAGIAVEIGSTSESRQFTSPPQIPD